MAFRADIQRNSVPQSARERALNPNDTAFVDLAARSWLVMHRPVTDKRVVREEILNVSEIKHLAETYPDFGQRLSRRINDLQQIERSQISTAEQTANKRQEIDSLMKQFGVWFPIYEDLLAANQRGPSSPAVSGLERVLALAEGMQRDPVFAQALREAYEKTRVFREQNQQTQATQRQTHETIRQEGQMNTARMRALRDLGRPQEVDQSIFSNPSPRSSGNATRIGF